MVVVASVGLNQVVIRKADHDDVGWLMMVLRIFNQEAGFKTSLMPGRDVAAEMLDELIDDHVFLVAEINCYPMGFVTGSIGTSPLNPSVLMFSEMLWWVDKGWRGKCSAGSMLLDAAVDAAKKRGVQMIWWCKQDNTNVRERSLLRRGFVRKEVMYLLEV